MKVDKFKNRQPSKKEIKRLGAALAKVKPLLSEFQGLPMGAWFTFAREKLEKTDDPIWFWVICGLYAELDKPLPAWARDIFMEWSREICSEVLSVDIYAKKKGDEQWKVYRPVEEILELKEHKDGMGRARKSVRDLRIAHAAFVLVQNNNISQRKAWETLRKRLPARRNGRDTEMPSLSTIKRAWKQVFRRKK